MAYTCKACGGQTIVDAQSGIATCEYCGTKQALPLFTEDSERLLYERGNNYLNHSEYDKAENVFSQLLTIRPGAAELYWDLVLCKYGVTYVKDPKTSKYIPTCNRTHYTPIFSDENYKKAIELSSGEKKALFEEDAETIDNIQKGIIAVSKKEKPFDIFISYKETDANGNRTKDSVEAQRLYEKLTEAGYKVFFSRITLEDKIGTEYEPYIYAALYSSKVMLTVCSSQENMEAAWVKNEWSRYLGFRQNDNSKTLLPLYFDMDKAALPEEFALLSAYDMRADGFADELLRGIKKLIPLPIMKAKQRKQILKAMGAVAAILVLIAGIAAAIVISQKKEEKRLTEEAAIRASEEVALEKANEDAYQAAMTLFDNADYTAAEAAFIALGDYKDSARMAARCPIQPDYDAAMQLYYDGKYAQATWAFEALGDYEDAAERKDKAIASWQKNLATVVASGYYITPNSTVADMENNKEVIHRGSHGKVISIAEDWDDIWALYEDGTLEGENIDSSQWKNVVQIIPTIPEGVGHIALDKDGNVLSEQSKENMLDEFAPVTEWSNVVMLAADVQAYDEFWNMMAVAAVDKEGEVSLCYYFHLGEMRTFMEHRELFTNVASLSISMHCDWPDEEGFVNAVALTHDKQLVAYVDGKIYTQEAEDVVAVSVVYDTVYLLHSDGNVRLLNSNGIKQRDVVHFSDGYAITRQGTVFENIKTYVHEEWLEKMR